MKINVLLYSLVVSLFCSCSSAIQPVGSTALETTFVAAPDTIKTSIYWYWMQDHMSKEGVIKDLQAMKAAGINRAFIGSTIGGAYLSEIPVGKYELIAEIVADGKRIRSFRQIEIKNLKKYIK